MGSGAATEMKAYIRKLQRLIDYKEGIDMNNWKPFSTAPKEGIFLVWLEEEHSTTRTRVAVMNRHPKLSIISGSFQFDTSKPLLWQELPEEPKE